jgi:hypothetical protein
MEFFTIYEKIINAIAFLKRFYCESCDQLYFNNLILDKHTCKQNSFYLEKAINFLFTNQEITYEEYLALKTLNGSKNGLFA